MFAFSDERAPYLDENARNSRETLDDFTHLVKKQPCLREGGEAPFAECILRKKGSAESGVTTRDENRDSSPGADTFAVP